MCSCYRLDIESIQAVALSPLTPAQQEAKLDGQEIHPLLEDEDRLWERTTLYNAKHLPTPGARGESKAAQQQQST